MAEPAAKRPKARGEEAGAATTYHVGDRDVHEAKSIVQTAMWTAQELCDVIVTLTPDAGGGESLHAHRVVLASASDYFRRRFVATAKDGSMQTICIDDLAPRIEADVGPLAGELAFRALHAAVGLAYRSEAEVPADLLRPLVSMLSALEMHALVRKAAGVLGEDLSPASALSILEFASVHHLDDLATRARALAAENFNDAMQEPSFRTVRADVLEGLLSLDELKVADEENLVNAILDWARAGAGEGGGSRAQALERLLPLLRWPLVPAATLQAVDADPLVSGTACWPGLKREAITYQASKSARGHSASSSATASAPPLRAQPRGVKLWKIYSVGGMDGRNVMSSVQRYCFRHAQWEAVAPMNVARVGLGAAVLNGFIYAAGGSDGTRRHRSVERFCPWRGVWEFVAPMSTPRGDVACCVVGGWLYAVGGRTHTTPLVTVERYSPRLDAWEPVASMHIPRYHVRVAVVGTHIYAVGGGERSRVDGRTSVERYCPRLNRWEMMPALATVREGVGVAVVGGALYAIGGTDGDDKLSTVERFHPDVGQWEEVAPMGTARTSHRVAVIGQAIYALGGYEGSGECHVEDPHGRLRSVEAYDPARGTWEPVADMSADAARRESRWHCHGAVVVA